MVVATDPAKERYGAQAGPAGRWPLFLAGIAALTASGIAARAEVLPMLGLGAVFGAVVVAVGAGVIPAAAAWLSTWRAARALAGFDADPSPHALTGGDGATLLVTSAFLRAVTADRAATVADLLAVHVAVPEAAMARLLTDARTAGAARRLVGPLAVTVRQLGRDRFLWRIETVGSTQDGAGAPSFPEKSPQAVPQAGNAGGADRPAEGLAEAIPAALVKIARDGTIREANGAARALLELGDGSFPMFHDLTEGVGRPVSEWLADAFEGRGLNKPEVMRRTAHARDLYLQVTLGRVVEDGEVLIIAILHDATEVKSLEAQFVQSQKMQAIGQLAGGVAHDFNNLLTAISGHCDLLLLRHDASDPDYADLTQISHNANRAASLVGQLLAFSRKQTMKAQNLDLADTMADLTHLLNRLVGEKVRLDLDVRPLKRVIRADRRQFEQVVMNLVVNARDAMPGGGSIRIEVHEKTLETTLVRDRAEVPHGEYLVVTVADTGAGIDADALPKIFEPFYTTKKTGEGTGLGLSTAYGIVKQSGGFIFAESRPGEGTCFTLYFPAVARPLASGDTPGPAASRARVPTGDGVVLLVEDEAPVRAFAARALRLRGYTVIEAADAEEALARLEDPGLEVDLFVTDVIMPGMDGPSWVKKALEKRPETRVVFVSGYAEENLAENQARVPNSVFLPKPFSLSDLTTIVHRQLAA